MVQFGHIFISIDSLDMSSRQLDIWVRSSEGRSWLEVWIYIYIHTHTIKLSALVSMVTLPKNL